MLSKDIYCSFQCPPVPNHGPSHVISGFSYLLHQALNLCLGLGSDVQSTASAGSREKRAASDIMIGDSLEINVRNRLFLCLGADRPLRIRVFSFPFYSVKGESLY